MKNKLLKKTAYLITAVGLGGTLLLGDLHAKDDNLTEITIIANKDEYTQTIRNNQPLQLNVGEPLKLNVTAYDEDGMDSLYAFTEAKKVPPINVYTPSKDCKSEDGKSIYADVNVHWFTKDNLQIRIVAKDKLGNTTRRTLDVYFE